ncbi:hypothetical protein R1sor_018094 [Riccia sorocarpa]|uniref:UDP N-acetylglucosamine O-acyltransferase C-terminal domain-containing protein n=1 Tax=Riccia sorocarpa TaxID=122646 RepID=A0ABD3IBG7_9MARC
MLSGGSSPVPAGTMTMAGNGRTCILRGIRNSYLRSSRSGVGCVQLAGRKPQRSFTHQDLADRGNLDSCIPAYQKANELLNGDRLLQCVQDQVRERQTVPCRIPKGSYMQYLPRAYCNYYPGLNRLTASAGSVVHPSSATTDSRIIHSTAVVHPESVLGEGVEIGAFCTVGPHVKLGSGCILHPGSHVFGDTQLGDNCVLFTGAVVGADIPGKTVIGNNNSVGYHAVVGVKCQDMKYKEGDECSLYIGDNNDIREFVSIHRSSKPDDETRVGNDNLIMGSCHIAHDCKIGNRNIFANGTLLGGHVVVEDLVHTGGAVAVHQFSHIGSYSFLAGGSMVDRDVPMFMMVAGDRAKLRGLNLEGMRRCGFSDVEVRSIRKVYQKLFMSNDAGIGIEEKLSELEQVEEFRAIPAVGMMLQSIRHCFEENRRGICSFRHWSSV